MARIQVPILSNPTGKVKTPSVLTQNVELFVPWWLENRVPEPQTKKGPPENMNIRILHGPTTCDLQIVIEGILSFM